MALKEWERQHKAEIERQAQAESDAARSALVTGLSLASNNPEFERLPRRLAALAFVHVREAPHVAGGGSPPAWERREAEWSAREAKMLELLDQGAVLVNESREMIERQAKSLDDKRAEADKLREWCVQAAKSIGVLQASAGRQKAWSHNARQMMMEQRQVIRELQLIVEQQKLELGTLIGGGTGE